MAATTIVMGDGNAIPAIGLGTWALRGMDGRRAMAAALDAGYRHIDTATMYGNEREVGRRSATAASPATTSS